MEKQNHCRLSLKDGLKQIGVQYGQRGAAAVSVTEMPRHRKERVAHVLASDPPDG